jgi:hypothetical protein
MSDDRGQMTEVRGQKSEGRGQKSEGRRQKADDREHLIQKKNYHGKTRKITDNVIYQNYLALIRKVQVTIKKPLWERLPAAKLNYRGGKPLPQPIQLVLSR